MRTIYLEPDEEITGVIEKLSKAESNNVRLVVPKGALLLQSLVNLKLLKKKADDLNKDIALITTDKIGRNLASQVGISVVGSNESLDRVEGKKGHVRDLDEIPNLHGVKVHRYYMPPQGEEEDILEIEEGGQEQAVEEQKEEPYTTEGTGPEPEVRHISVRAHSGKARYKKPVLIVLVVLFLAAFAGTIYIFGPRAEATVYVKGEPYVANVDISVDQNVKTANKDTGMMPASVLAAEETAKTTAKATGKKDVGQKAKGQIVVTNSWDQNSQPLVAGTRFVADGSGKVFRTVSDAQVPGATISLLNGSVSISPSTAQVNVEADEPGDSYNIGASRFTIPGLSAEKQQKIYGNSGNAMTGGVSKQVTIVSDSDIKSAKENAQTEAQKKAKETALKNLNGGIALDSEEVEQVDSKVGAKVGDEVETFTAESSVKVTLLAISKDSLVSLANDMAMAKVPQDKNITFENNGEPKYKVDSVSVKDGKASLSVSLNGVSYPKIDKDAIRDKLRGKNSSGAQEVLKGTPAEKIEVRLTPSIFKRLPLRREQIKVIVKTF